MAVGADDRQVPKPGGFPAIPSGQRLEVVDMGVIGFDIAVATMKVEPAIGWSPGPGFGFMDEAWQP